MSGRDRRYDQLRGDEPIVREAEPAKRRLDVGKVAAVDLDPGQIADLDIDVGKVSRAGRQHPGPPGARQRRIDRRAEPGRGTLAPADVDAAAALLEGFRYGAPLPPELLRRLSAELGVDLRHVRIHTDSHAAEIAAAFGARAIAVDEHIYFAAGAYDPESAAGIELIAHEVAHVVQHARQAPVDDTQVSRPEQAHEQEAERFASAFVAADIGARGDGAGSGQPAGANTPTTTSGVTHTAQQSAPGGAGDDRTKVGVGEKIDFTADTDGKWDATNAHGPKTKTGKTFTWIAPVTADSVTVTFTPTGGPAQPTSMTVIAPTDVEFTKTSDITSIKSGTAGVGMVTNIKFLPLDVSFAFTSWLEIAGGPSGQTGYFTKHTAPNHKPNPKPLHLGSDNAGPTDTAEFWGFGKPWDDGTFEWVIPNHYVVDGETAPGHKFTDIHQTAKLETSGRMTVAKGTAGGATATRDADGTIALAEPDPSADASDVTAVGEGVIARGDAGGTDGGGGAATITHTTQQVAPKDSDTTRTKVGVGEKVDFESDADGTWTASAAFGAKTKKGTTFTWQAPTTATTATVTFLPKSGAAQKTTMTVVAPSDLEYKNTGDETWPAGHQGAGMNLNVKLLPLDVSFAFTSLLEIGGAAGKPQNITGYFIKHHAISHTPTATPSQVGSDNIAFDEANLEGWPAPWTDGSFEWVIPTHYLVNGESKPGHHITDIHQTFKLEGEPNAGRTTVTKGTNGAKAIRSPDGSVAMNAAEGVDATATEAGTAIGNMDPGGGKAPAAPVKTPNGSARSLLQQLDALKLGAEIATGVASLDALRTRIREMITAAEPSLGVAILSPGLAFGIGEANNDSIGELNNLDTKTMVLAQMFKALEQEWQQIENSAGALARAGAANPGALVPRIELLKLRLSQVGGIEHLRAFVGNAKKQVGDIGERTGVKVAEYATVGGNRVLGGSDITDAFDVDMAKFDLGVLAGIGTGIYEAVRDTVMFVPNTLNQLKELQDALLHNGLSAFVDAANKILNGLKNVKELPGVLGKRWKAGNDFQKGDLCGEVAGYLGTLVAIMALTQGASVVAELAGLSGELAELSKLVMQVTNPLDSLGPLGETAKEFSDGLKGWLRGASRGGDELGGVGTRGVGGTSIAPEGGTSSGVPDVGTGATHGEVGGNGSTETTPKPAPAGAQRRALEPMPIG